MRQLGDERGELHVSSGPGAREPARAGSPDRTACSGSRRRARRAATVRVDWSWSVYTALISTTGVARPRPFISRTSSKPFLRGSWTSTRQRSGTSRSKRSMPSGPDERRDRLVAVGRQEVDQDHLVDRIVLDDEDLLHVALYQKKSYRHSRGSSAPARRPSARDLPLPSAGRPRTAAERRAARPARRRRGRLEPRPGCGDLGRDRAGASAPVGPRRDRESGRGASSRRPRPASRASTGSRARTGSARRGVDEARDVGRRSSARSYSATMPGAGMPTAGHGASGDAEPQRDARARRSRARGPGGAYTHGGGRRARSAREPVEPGRDPRAVESWSHA